MALPGTLVVEGTAVVHPWRSWWCTHCCLQVLLLHINSDSHMPDCPIAPLAQLLVHPLVRRRSGLLAAALEFATLPILLFKPTGSDISSLVAAAQSGGLLGGLTSAVAPEQAHELCAISTQMRCRWQYRLPTHG